MSRRVIIAAILAAGPAHAETVVAARTIAPGETLSVSDLRLLPETTPGGMGRIDAAVGLEARVAIYEGRPVRAGDLTPPALVDRNELVRLIYISDGLTITTEGRALDRGAAGARVRVMNLGSRTTVTGTASAPATVTVR